MPFAKRACVFYFKLHQFDCHAEILFVGSGWLPVRALTSAAKVCWKVRECKGIYHVAVDFLTIHEQGRIYAACKTGGC